MARAVVLCLALLAVSCTAMDLTAENFEKEVFESGKSGFVKFFAPWCGHCKRMKPAWDELMKEYDGSDKVVVGDVDCTVQRDLCSTHGIRGYPTVKYFKAGDKTAQDYRGGRDLDSLKKHAASL
eukprot:TRINITY_DN20_c0_g1_i1.p2 TRINITY_DN20_c0_g1~~TRINITY_DN20_c0_g1_i1.p2  ORF type:complete len:124 (+),score=49.15 TRINITY_DN20_c0_g1_i1:76-447(+)